MPEPSPDQQRASIPMSGNMNWGSIYLRNPILVRMVVSSPLSINAMPCHAMQSASIATIALGSRKVVWDCISSLVRAGFTAQVAIDRIFNVYGLNAPVTRIINQMKRDRNAGNLHRSLQI
jgi:hypothetical protein